MQKLFDGCYEDVPTIKMIARLTWEVLKAKSDLIVLPGYHRPEYWAMLAAYVVTGKRRAVFCDSTGRDRPKKLSRLFRSACFSRCATAISVFGGAQPRVSAVARREAREDFYTVSGRRTARFFFRRSGRWSSASPRVPATRRCFCTSGVCRKKKALAR